MSAEGGSAWTGVRLGLAFLTRLPGPDGIAADRTFGASVLGWPLAGPLVGAAAVGGLTLGAWGVSPAFGAVLAVVGPLWLTRGFHLDGLSDCLDGLLCNGDRARTLAVMHDPHVGALASAGMTLALVSRVVLVLACVDHGTALGALLFAPTLARLPLALEVLLARPASDTGLLATLHRHVQPWHVAIATAGAVLSLVPIAALVSGGAALAAVIGCFLVTAVWHVVWIRRIGGLNGDVLGAAVELRELCALCALGSPLLT